MDMDVNRPVQPTQIYEVAGLRFRGGSPDQMLADKISAISTGKVFRRIKDVVDLYYLSQVFEFDLNRLQKTLSNSDKLLEVIDDYIKFYFDKQGNLCVVQVHAPNIYY